MKYKTRSGVFYLIFGLIWLVIGITEIIQNNAGAYHNLTIVIYFLVSAVFTFNGLLALKGYFHLTITDTTVTFRHSLFSGEKTFELIDVREATIKRRIISLGIKVKTKNDEFFINDNFTINFDKLDRTIKKYL